MACCVSVGRDHMCHISSDTYRRLHLEDEEQMCQMKYNFELHLDLLLHLYCDVPLLKGNLTNFDSYHDKIPEAWEESHNAHYCKSYGPTNKIPQMLKKGGSKIGV